MFSHAREFALGVPKQLHPIHDATPPQYPKADPVDMEYQAANQGYDNYAMPPPEYQEPHGWSPYLSQPPPDYSDQTFSEWGTQFRWSQQEGTFMNLLVGPSTSEYGTSSCEYGGHQSTSDMGGITQLEYTQQAPTHDLGDTINYHHYGGDTQLIQDPGDLTQERGIEDASQQE
jgi:hypothetical protein